jgi:hypothetical protein
MKSNHSNNELDASFHERTAERIRIQEANKALSLYVVQANTNFSEATGVDSLAHRQDMRCLEEAVSALDFFLEDEAGIMADEARIFALQLITEIELFVASEEAPPKNTFSKVRSALANLAGILASTAEMSCMEDIIALNDAKRTLEEHAAILQTNGNINSAPRSAALKRVIECLEGYSKKSNEVSGHLLNHDFRQLRKQGRKIVVEIVSHVRNPLFLTFLSPLTLDTYNSNTPFIYCYRSRSWRTKVRGF